MNKSKSQELIYNSLKQKNITDFKGGIQLFADQYDDQWSISVGYSSTGIHIPKNQIDILDLQDDDVIKICRTWTYKEKEN